METILKVNSVKQKAEQPSGSYEHIQAYYREATADYHEWSKQFNMHFGYYRRGLSPFRREGMLNEMNKEVLNRLLRLTTIADWRRCTINGVQECIERCCAEPEHMPNGYQRSERR